MGCTTAHNKGGGGSSAIYIMGRVVNHPLDCNRVSNISEILFLVT